MRLDDQPALLAAIARGEPVIPVFIWSPEDEGDWQPGAASRWWLHRSLTQLDQQLKVTGSRLILRRGSALPELLSLIDETQASAVYWTRRYEPDIIARDSKMKSELRQRSVIAESFNGQLLFEPWDVQTKEGRPYQVFTAFWKACLKRPSPDKPQPAPQKIPAPELWPRSIPLKDLALNPKLEWDTGFKTVWQPGAFTANEQLDRFLQTPVIHYQTNRDLPATPGTSRLSPYLHFGEISPRAIWHRCFQEQSRDVNSDGMDCFLREIGWREFANHLLFHFPRTVTEPLRFDFARFPWKNDPQGVKAWQRGETGYPIVDAGMRELWTTGWMHNRVRMIVGSFLVKDLLAPWQQGARWFWDTLVDADLASNTLGWQWIAGCGADAAPFFRIFNPVLQSQKFDSEGHYIRRWIPELKDMPSKWIHAPWTAPSHVLRDSKVSPGHTYPEPIVNHNDARQHAMAALRQITSDSKASNSSSEKFH